MASDILTPHSEVDVGITPTGERRRGLGIGWAIACVVLVAVLVFAPPLLDNAYRIGLLATILGNALSPGRLAQPPFESVENPAGIDAIGGWTEAVIGFGFWLTLASILLAGTSLVYRFRRARGPERQQLKWFAGSAVLFVATSAAYTVLPGVPEQFGQIATLFAFAGIPLAVGIAILRHSLYDIDVLINRTLVYGLLTLSLALVYSGGVVLSQGVLRALTGQGSTLAVVASTLVIAALFNPLRRRIQTFIDRRFYRSKYDAAKTLAAFTARLREETELDTLSGDVVGVVRETMQPEHASLWLRSLEGRADEKESETTEKAL